MSTPISAELLVEVGAVIRGRLGLHYPIERVRELEGAMHHVAAALHCDGAEECARRIVDQPLSSDELKALAQALTVGETSFYRDPSVFRALEREIFPSLIEARRQNEKRLRVWSAGCCTGEEPYTVAMILTRLIPDLADWNITILATDVNAEFLLRAQRGVYGKWSFRRTPAWMSRQFFEPQAEGKFELKSAIRQMVTFDYLNLAESLYPSVFNNTNAMDVVLCRNVLIYFDQPAVERVVGRLRSSLLPGGWLALGRSERVPEKVEGFEPVSILDDYWYRRGPIDAVGAPNQSPPKPPPPAIVRAMPFPVELQALFDRGDYGAVVRDLRRYLNQGRPSRADRGRAMRMMAKACANLGQLEEAQSWCEEAISEHRLDAPLHYLLASVLLERDCPSEAESSLERALVADDRYVLARFALGNLHRRQYGGARARTHYERTLALLHHYHPEETLPDSEGLTAGELSEIAELALAQC